MQATDCMTAMGEYNIEALTALISTSLDLTLWSREESLRPLEEHVQPHEDNEILRQETRQTMDDIYGVLTNIHSDKGSHTDRLDSNTLTGVAFFSFSLISSPRLRLLGIIQ